jgi:hypothetical protein
MLQAMRRRYRERQAAAGTAILPTDRITPLDQDRGPGMFEFWNYQDLLLAEGQILWATTIQVNMELFSPATSASVGELLCSPDEFFSARPAELTKIAHYVYDLKGTTPADVELAQVAARITDEYYRAYGERIPAILAGEREIYRFTTIFFRQHIPWQMLGGRQMPVLYHAQSPFVMVLPHWHWSAALLEEWRPPLGVLEEWRAERTQVFAGPVVQMTEAARAKMAGVVRRSRQHSRDSSIRIHFGVFGNVYFVGNALPTEGDHEIDFGMGVVALIAPADAEIGWGSLLDLDEEGYVYAVQQ